MVNWERLICCRFADGSTAAATVIDNYPRGDRLVKIDDPDNPALSISVQVDKDGRSLRTGMRVIENVTIGG